MDISEMVKSNLDESAKILNDFRADESKVSAIVRAATLMIDCIRNGGKIISCGNGGSMCDAMHFAEELTGRFRNDRKALPAVSISDPSHISCVGNDYGFEFVFSRYVEAVGCNGDMLLAITTSGNSVNVLKAAEVAHKKGMKVVGLTGKDGGSLASLCDVEIRVPHMGFADRTQEMHIKVIHCMIQAIEEGVR
ncbi:MAG: D-sedoheptulose 7-phosphate isomerase [Bacteroidota bacterium]